MISFGAFFCFVLGSPLELMECDDSSSITTLAQMFGMIVLTKSLSALRNKNFVQNK
jgi:hypothetical protein